jgi:MarR family transcriptional regulator, lower aerobic nicotinate degradation pathway regulator
MNAAQKMPILLRAAYLAMHRSTNAHLARSGVTADQFVLLCVLAKGSALTQQDLARRSSSDPNTIRPMLEILERRGLVTRQWHPSDGRARTVRLTAKGLRTWNKLIAASEPVRERLLAVFRPAEIPVVLKILGRIAEAMDLPISRVTGLRRAPPDKIKTRRHKPASRRR